MALQCTPLQPVTELPALLLRAAWSRGFSAGEGNFAPPSFGFASVSLPLLLSFSLSLGSAALTHAARHRPWLGAGTA